MPSATDLTVKESDRVEDLIKRGNRLHDQAVADFFTRWVPAALRSIAGSAAKAPEAKRTSNGVGPSQRIDFTCDRSLKPL